MAVFELRHITSGSSTHDLLNISGTHEDQLFYDAYPFKHIRSYFEVDPRLNKGSQRWMAYVNYVNNGCIMKIKYMH